MREDQVNEECIVEAAGDTIYEAIIIISIKKLKAS